MSEERLTMTIKEACRKLGISRNLGYALVQRGEFPGAIKLGQKRIVVSKFQMERYLAGNNNDDGAANAR